MGVDTVKISISKEGKIIVSISNESCHLSEGQVNMLIEKLIAAKHDVKEFKDASRTLNFITKKYNGNEIESNYQEPNITGKILLEDEK
jgi:propanediol utilization protein